MIFPTVNIVYAPAVLISQYMAAVKRFRASGCIDTAAAFGDSLYIITYMLRVVKRFFEISRDFFGRYGVRSCAQCPGANRPRRLRPAARSVAWFRYCGLIPAAAGHQSTMFPLPSKCQYRPALCGSFSE